MSTIWQLLSLQAPPIGARCEYVAIIPDVYATHGEGIWHEQSGNVQWHRKSGNVQWQGFIQDADTGILPQIFTSDPTCTVWRLAQPDPPRLEPTSYNEWVDEYLKADRWNYSADQLQHMYKGFRSGWYYAP